MSADLIPFATPNHTGAGLSERECRVIANAIPTLPGAWHLQHDTDNLGHITVALIPGRDHHGHEAPVFLIWREDTHLHLGIGQGDFYAGLGTHTDVEHLVHAVRHTLDGVATPDEWVSCELDSPAWNTAPTLDMPKQSHRPN